jgi:glycosyltransferase involved in cell wall biosynthesis
VLHIEAGRHLYGGARQVLYLLEGLTGRGIENVLACPVASDIARAARGLARVCEMPMRGDADFWLALRLWRLIRDERPDIVHVHSRRGAEVWGGIAARLAGVPCVMSRRVDNPEPRWLVAMKYRLYGHVITISAGIRHVLIAEGMPPAKVTCVRSALDPGPYSIEYDKPAYRQGLGVPADTLVVGVIAQLIPRKGHRYLLAALPEVLLFHPGVQVLIFGRGPLEADLRQAINAQRLAGHVRLMGFIDNLPEVLGCLDLVVHPAEMEGLGVSLLQASAAGVPIIASRAGGMPEAVRDGVNGLLVPPGDAKALARAMLRLLGDADLRGRMGVAGRELVSTEFSVDAMCAGNLAVYHQLLSE